MKNLVANGINIDEQGYVSKAFALCSYSSGFDFLNRFFDLTFFFSENVVELVTS